MIAVHSKFRSDAERLLGWAMVKLHQATHLVYRPRGSIFPMVGGHSTGQPGRWTMTGMGFSWTR